MMMAKLYMFLVVQKVEWLRLLRAFGWMILWVHINKH